MCHQPLYMAVVWKCVEKMEEIGILLYFCYVLY